MNQTEDGEVKNGRPLPTIDSRWKLSKEIPISVVVFLIFQAILLAIFLTSQNNKLDSLAISFHTLQDRVYTKEDAVHEREFQEQKYQILSNKDQESQRRITILEGQVGELLNRARQAR